MIPSTNYEQHRTTRRRAGEPVCKGIGASSSAARKDEQDWRGNTAGIFAGLPCGAHLMTSQLGRRLRSPVPSHSIRLATALIAKPVRLHCGGRRRLTVHSRLVGRLNCRGYSARTLRLDVAHHVCQDKSDTPHRHLQRLSTSVGFNANRHSERRLAREQIQVSREQNE